MIRKITKCPIIASNAAVSCHCHAVVPFISLLGLTISQAFFVGDVNIFGMRLFIQIRYFFVNNRNVFVLGLFSLTGTVSTSRNLAKEGARARQSLLALRARAFAKFGEVDTVPVGENSLKYNTFC